MESPDGHRSRPGRPRNHGLDDLIRAATVELLVEGGEPAASLDDVAARAGVGKATIYRRWTSKRGLILDALTAHLPIELPAADRGSLAADAGALLIDLVALLGTPHARAARQLLPQLATWPELAGAYRHGVLDPWHTALHAVATRAHARGEAADPAPVQLALEAAAARICLPWLVDPGTDADADADADPAARAGRVEDLMRTLVNPPPGR